MCQTVKEISLKSASESLHTYVSVQTLHKNDKINENAGTRHDGGN